MGFGVADLIGVSVIKSCLDHLRRNPHHLSYILSKFELPGIQEFVGPKHIKNCIDMIVNNRILVVPYNTLNLQQMPNISVGALYNEEQQYLGDQGEVILSGTVEPKVYANFNINGIGVDPTTDENSTSIFVDNSYDLSSKVWLGLYVVKGSFYAQIDCIIPHDTYEEVVLTSAIPSGTAFTGWKAQTLSGTKIVNLNGSTDQVSLPVQLETSGDIGVHNLYATVLRYCLKSGRMLFDNYGIQATIIGQGLPIIEGGQGDVAIIKSVFTVTGKMTDTWIDSETSPLERSYESEITAKSEDTSDEEVVLQAT